MEVNIDDETKKRLVRFMARTAPIETMRVLFGADSGWNENLDYADIKTILLSRHRSADCKAQLVIRFH